MKEYLTTFPLISIMAIMYCIMINGNEIIGNSPLVFAMKGFHDE